MQLNLVGLLARQGKFAEAVVQLRRLEPQRLAWVGAELSSTQGGGVRRQMLSAQATFQDIVVSVAMASGMADAVLLAGDVLLRWKGLQATEEAYLARLGRRAEDPRVKALAGEIASLRTRTAHLAQAEQIEAALLAQGRLETREVELARLSHDYKRHLEVSRATLGQIQASLRDGEVLVEFRQYRPLDFKELTAGEPRWAALVVSGLEEPLLIDAGPVATTSAALVDLLHDPAAAGALWDQLLGEVKEELQTARRVYVSPDGLLNLVPFEQLPMGDGQPWGTVQDVRFVTSGRELLPEPVPGLANRPKGLLALGGIDFGTPGQAGQLASLEPAGDPAAAAEAAVRTAFEAFKDLPETAAEAGEVAELYRALRRNEPVAVWQKADASEARLKRLDGLAGPPRVLHLATHGFYLDAATALPLPLLRSGLSLAGANRAGEAVEGEEDGILYALEAQSLNLEGTELVVLSACETGRGSIDYSEGVDGLVRALRIAGAQRVLMTLWPVNDRLAKEFMVEFYQTWLQQQRSDPAAALRAVKVSWQSSDDPARRDPRNWAPYVLIGA